VRLSQGREVPNAIVWGEADRNALVRLPVLATSPDGRRVAPPTVEFRLPDGSAHPHLLLAGIAQSMLHGRGTREIEVLLRQTAAAERRAGTGPATPVPKSFPEVAEALGRHRAALEQGGIFPAGLIDQMVERLKR
jgi:glutamine synthetase